MLMLSVEHHMVMSSTVSDLWKKKLVVQRSLFLWKVCGRFLCQKWSKVVWMDGRQSGVQKDRLGNFQWKNFSMELWLYTGLLRLLVASEVSEGRVWCVCACELWGQVWLQKFWSLSGRCFGEPDGRELMMSMSLHLKCNPACFGLRCLFDLDGRNCAAGCHLQKTG